jgi:hypothetical protein
LWEAAKLQLTNACDSFVGPGDECSTCRTHIAHTRLSRALSATKPGEGYWLREDAEFWRALDSLMGYLAPRLVGSPRWREGLDTLLDQVEAADPRRESVESRVPRDCSECGQPCVGDDGDGVTARHFPACPVVQDARPKPSPAPTVSGNLAARVVDDLLNGDGDEIRTRSLTAQVLAEVIRDYASRHGLQVEGEK